MMGSNASIASASSSSQIRIAALGGLGEIGLNLMFVECGGDALVIDAGAMFPDERSSEGDTIIPQMAALASNGRRLRGVILTHAHEDHIGALPYLLARFPVPVYGSELAIAFVRRRLREHRVEAAGGLNIIAPRVPFRLGPFEIEALRVTHSTPDSFAFAVRTPAGLIVHSGDFKIDNAPVDGAAFDRDRFEELGARGVILLLSDSTNVERPGRTPSESSLKPVLREIISRTRGKFVLSTFSSHIHRIRQAAEISRQYGRSVVPLGRRVVESIHTGIELGHLPLPPGSFIDWAEAGSLPAERLTVIASGSQGEPFSALAQIAAGTHPRIQIEPGDVVVLSSRSIPGNERAVNSLINQLYRHGAEVVYEEVAPVHVSGHASRDELAELIRLLQPRYFVPIHGEYRHLACHVALAVETGVPQANCFLLENGDVLTLEDDRAFRGSRVEAGKVLATRGDELSALELIHERQALARDGAVVAVLAVSRDSGRIVAGPDFSSRGFIAGGSSSQLQHASAELRSCLENLNGALGNGKLEEEFARLLRRYFHDELGRRPTIVPCIVRI